MIPNQAVDAALYRSVDGLRPLSFYKLMKTLTAVIVILCLCSCSDTNPEVTPKKDAGNKMDIDLQWGGYYASKEEGRDEYGVFRLLDFNCNAYHITIYREKFAEIPTLEDVLQLSPYIGHAPIDSRALLRERDIHLVGGPVLTEDDLEGYRVYLEHHEVAEDDISELFRNVVGFGMQPPMKLTLTLVNGELDITER